jgi:two-component system, cell cycle sensor histidine kinase and response regulator CckA
VQLSSVVREMLSMLQVSISKKAMLRVNFAEDQPAIEADVTQVRQIVLNLVMNASDAIGEQSGAIAISTGVMGCDQAYLKTTWLKDPLREGIYAYLEVADSGCGIAKEQLLKIFDPFFTTKFTGRGLGLAAVLGIVRGHKGAIKVVSEAGHGTTFTVLFPVTGAAPNLPAGSKAGEVHWRGKGLILLVDDEESIRDIGKRMLQYLGFEVIVATDGRDALAQIREHGDRITVILLDLTMPHMDGAETFRELQQIRTDIPVVLSSGYSKQDVVERFAGKGIAGFIPKPYTLGNLQTVLQPLLGDVKPPPSAPGSKHG